MIILIDNYDSFVHNLYQLLGCVSQELMGEADLCVVRNDELTVAQIADLQPTHLVISPGPGHPSQAGIIEDAIAALSGHVPILGVCLGHQALCEVFGATIIHAKTLVHGKADTVITHGNSRLLAPLGLTFQAARYHSLTVDPHTLPPTLGATAHTADGEVMAVEHTAHPTFGIQFHPESIMTPAGRTLLRQFLNTHPT